MKIAVAQISCSLGDPEANLSKVHDFSRRAKDVSAELIVFPEMTDTGYSMSVIQKHADEWNSGFVPGLRDIASQLSIAIVSGVSERDGSSIYNSQILVDSLGKSAAKYRKTHLYAVAPVEEQTCFAPGDGFASFALGDLRFCAVELHFFKESERGGEWAARDVVEDVERAQRAAQTTLI